MKCLQGKRKAQTSHSPSTSQEPATVAAETLARTEECLSCPVGPPAPATPSPASRTTKRARRQPAALADFTLE